MNHTTCSLESPSPLPPSSSQCLYAALELRRAWRRTLNLGSLGVRKKPRKGLPDSMVPGKGKASARCPGSKAHFQCHLLDVQAGQEAGQLPGSLCPGPLCSSFPVWPWRPASGPQEGRPSLPWPPGHYLVRLYPCCSEEKSRRGWQRANRSGIHDQMSLISFTLTISEWKFSAWTARCTNCLGRAGRGSGHSGNPSPDHTAHPGGVQRLSGELGLEGTSHLFSQVRAWA